MIRWAAGVLALVMPAAALAQADKTVVLVDGKNTSALVREGADWKPGRAGIECAAGADSRDYLFALVELGDGDFIIKAQLTLEKAAQSEAAFVLGHGFFSFAGAQEKSPLVVSGPDFCGGTNGRVVVPNTDGAIKEKTPFTFEARGAGTEVAFLIDGKPVHKVKLAGEAPRRFGFTPGRAKMEIHQWAVKGKLALPRKITDEEVKPLQPKIDRAIDRGVSWLLRTQQRDGSWSQVEKEYANGATALCAYTLLKAGLAPTHPAVRQALAYLQQAVPKETYSLGCQLMAFEAAADPSHRAHLEELLKALLAIQNAGEWTYRAAAPGSGGDLSNTQYAALGLRAADLAGLEVPRDAYKKLLTATLKHQTPRTTVDLRAADGRTGTTRAPAAGFGYGHGPPAGGSMTSAGVAILKICEHALTGGDAKRARDAAELGLNWMAHEFSVRTNPKGMGDWTYYYYLYGLERMGALAKLTHVGGRAWYYEGAIELLWRQGPDGAWGSEADTCFAILFLKRATSLVATGGMEIARNFYESEREESDVWMRARGDSPMEIWISGFSRKAKDALKTGAGALAGIHVARVEYRVDGQVVKTIEADVKKPWAADKFPFTYGFPRRGRYHIDARVHVVDPTGKADGKDPKLTIIEAEGFDIFVASAYEPWMEEAARIRAANLLRDAGVTAQATSSNGDGHKPEFAADGVQGTLWLCNEKDNEPTLALELRKPVRADTVVLCPADAHRWSAGQFDRITKVEIRINKEKEPRTLLLHPYELRPSALSLPEPETIQRLEVKIVGRLPGNPHRGRAGFSEVTLELRGARAAAAAPVGVVEQSPNGSISAFASEAVPHGAAIQTRWIEDDLFVSHWSNPADWVSWRLRVSKPGTFEAELDYACDDAQAGSAFTLGVGEKSLAGKVEGTQGAARGFKLGRLEITAAGDVELTLKCAARAKDWVMNVRSVRLTPVP
jgi:hypothetical protein